MADEAADDVLATPTSSVQRSARPEISAPSRLLFAFGGTATGIINNGFASFVLLYYNLVLGVSASLVGAALAIALAFDAVSDPIVGYISDHYRSRWGRRHPFIYISIIPVSALFYLLWNPPLAILSGASLFAFLLVTSILLRLLITFYEVPSNALVPELTEDYDNRTKLLNMRWSTYFFAANGITLVLYGYWLRDTPEYPNGLLNPAGYNDMGLYGTGLILIAMLFSALALHRYIPHLIAPQEDQSFSAKRMYGDMFRTFSDRALLALLLGGVFFASANGMINALWAYMFSYFWGLSTAQMSIMLVAYTLGAVVAFLATRTLTRGREKQSIAVGVAIASMIVIPGPVVLRLLGLFPGPDSPFLFPLLLIYGLVELTLYVMFTTMAATLMSDIVERRQLATGKRLEGVLYSSQTFIVKITSGMGAFLAGLALDFINFPTNADLADIDPSTIDQLGTIYAPSIFILYGIAALAISQCRVSRADHLDNLRRLGDLDV